MDVGACFAVALLLVLIVVIVALVAATNTRTTTYTTYIAPRQEVKREGLSELKQIERAGQAELDQAYNRYLRRVVDHYATRAARSTQSKNQR